MSEATRSSHRQVGWVIDLNRCIGCQTCSVACKVLWTQGEGEEPNHPIGDHGGGGRGSRHTLPREPEASDHVSAHGGREEVVEEGSDQVGLG